MSIRFVRVLVLGVGCGGPVANVDAGAEDTDAISVCATPAVGTTFGPSSAGLVALEGAASLRTWDPDGAGWAPSVSTTDALGLPTLGDDAADVLTIPGGPGRRGLLLAHPYAPNGYYDFDGKTSRYTLVVDVLVPTGSAPVGLTLLQGDPTGGDVPELLAVAGEGGGFGSPGELAGALEPGRWHRVAAVVRASDRHGMVQKYVDGRFVGGESTDGIVLEDPWALGAELLTLVLPDGSPGPVHVAGLRFVGEALAYEDVLALGGPTPSPLGCGAPPPPPPVLPPRAVKAIAHRGDSCCAPENTLSALRQAFDKGAYGVEADVYVTADGHVVFFHDPFVQRTTDGVGGVSGLTLDELQAFDAGSWFGDAFVGERVPSLAEALGEARGRGRILLDIKERSPRMAAGIAAALAEAGVGPEAVWIWASEEEIPMYAEEVASPQFLLDGSPLGRTAEDFAALQAKGVIGFSFGAGGLEPVSAQAARDAGLFVEVFTVNTPSGMIDVAARGADAMETDYPSALLELVDAIGDQSSE